jgi:CBS domain-containing protein
MTTVETIIRNKGARVITLPTGTTVAEAARALNKHRIGAVVVSEDGATVNGIFSERDLVRQLAEHGAAAFDRPLRTAMTRHVMTCTTQSPVHEVMSVMTRKRIRHLPVLSQSQLVGIVSIGDVVKCRLEEMRLEASAMRDYAIARA